MVNFANFKELEIKLWPRKLILHVKFILGLTKYLSQDFLMKDIEIAMLKTSEAEKKNLELEKQMMEAEKLKT